MSDRRKQLCTGKGVRGGGKEGRREVKGMGERDNELLESQHGGGRGAGTRRCRARRCLGGRVRERWFSY